MVKEKLASMHIAGILQGGRVAPVFMMLLFVIHCGRDQFQNFDHSIFQRGESSFCTGDGYSLPQPNFMVIS